MNITLIMMSLVFTHTANASLDLWMQDKLKWDNIELAQRASDVTQLTLMVSPFVASALQKEDRGKKLLVVSGVTLFNNLSTGLLKIGTHRERPNGENFKSFPSGHTSSAFVGASLTCFMVDKYSCGFLMGVAALTGYWRIAGNKHWFTDVVAGMALGLVNGRVAPSLVFTW